MKRPYPYRRLGAAITGEELPASVVIEWGAAEVRDLVASFGLSLARRLGPGVTAAAVTLGEADYTGLWVTYDRAPYLLRATWYPVLGAAL